MFTLQLDWDRPAKIAAHASEHVLRVRLQPQANATTRSLPLRLALALDTSASMQGDKLRHAKQACQTILAQLRDQDQLSLASFATRLQTHLQAVSGKARNQARSPIDRLTADGVTRVDLALDWLQTALPAEPGVARVAILVTDGQPTNSHGRMLEDTSHLVQRAATLAEAGIVLCSVGLGDAANFNTDFLVQLSDTGRGAFLYADTPSALEPQLRDRLQACQAIVADRVTLKLEPASGVTVQGFCQFRPEYLPLEETQRNQLSLSNVRADGPTDILIELSLPPLTFGEPLGSRPAIAVELQAASLPPIRADAAIQYTNAYSDAQQVHKEINDDRLFWEINRDSTEMQQTNDPKRTGELAANIYVAATKTGQTALANQAAQILDDIERSGQVSAHKSTGLLRDSRHLGGTK